MTADGACASGRIRVETAMRSEPGPMGGSASWRRYGISPIPASRTISPRAAASSSSSPAPPLAYAAMSEGSTPAAVSAPMTDPADVPLMTSALEGLHPVSDSSASRAPMSQEPPTIPPAPSTSPIRMGVAPTSRLLAGPRSLRAVSAAPTPAGRS
jgi:hypothetical protein